MLIGIIGCFLAVLLIGIDGRFVTPWQFLIICQARAWTMSTGFTLAFGAMFSKVWRVHRLSTKAKADQGKVSLKCDLVYYRSRPSDKVVRVIFRWCKDKSISSRKAYTPKPEHSLCFATFEHEHLSFI